MNINTFSENSGLSAVENQFVGYFNEQGNLGLLYPTIAVLSQIKTGLMPF